MPFVCWLSPWRTSIPILAGTLCSGIPEGFQLQLQALESLARFGVNVHPALMISFSSPEEIDTMKNSLGNIRRDFAEVEIEELVVYGDLEDRLIKANLLH